MPPFSIFTIVIIFFIIFKKNSLWEKYINFFTLTVVYEMNKLSGYFIKLGGREIECSDILLMICTILAVYFIYKKGKVKKMQIYLAFFLLLSVFIGIIHTMLVQPVSQIRDYSGNWDSYVYGTSNLSYAVISWQSVLMTIRLILFIIISFTIIYISNEESYKITNKCIKLTKFHILYAFIEVLTKYTLKVNWMTQLKNFILGVGHSTYISFIVRGSGISINGLTREPSHLSEALFLFIVLCILSEEIRSNKFWIMLAIFVMLFSMSFSTVMYGFILIILYIYVNQIKIKWNLKMMLGSFIIFTALSIAIYVCLNNDYYSNRISGFLDDANIIFSGVESFKYTQITSSKVRLLGIRKTFDAFLERPLFGFGIGTAYCNSGIVSLLSNIGIISTLIWILFCLNIANRKRNDRKTFIKFLIVTILPNIVKGGIGMLYGSYCLMLVMLIRRETSYDKKKLNNHNV